MCCQQQLQMPSLRKFTAGVEEIPSRFVNSKPEDKNSRYGACKPVKYLTLRATSALHFCQNDPKVLDSPVARTNHTDFLGCCHHDFDLQEGAAAGAKTDPGSDTEYLYQTHTHTAEARHTLQGWLVLFQQTHTHISLRSCLWDLDHLKPL